jgi:2-C-methyl-D-erythritol 4-phosphate cytidylyltransferase/2-C-methyl-D-erythritol 2,4-cyclodiphosphate synthase
MDTAYADAVIVAAGASRRMAGVDKMDASLCGRPLLQWSVAAMAAASSVDRIVVVARPDQVEPLRRSAWLADIAADRATIVAGGARRSDSVRAGVEATSASVVLVHDGARPLASAALVDAVAAAAARHGAAVPVVPVVDSLKRATGEVLAGSVEREGLVRTQTPQGARREILVESIEAAGSESFSDEAALLESRGVRVASVPGEAANLKVTDRDDLELVRAIAAGRAAGLDSGAVSFGFGQDSHGFGPGDGLRLGGIEIAEAPRLFGHSDGDVVLHALATAILSAAGLGDLGRRFPSDDPRTAGVDSSRLLGDVVEGVAKAGWQVSRAQVALIGARPRLGGRVEDIRIRIGELLALGEDEVSVTASTGNLNGAEGAGRVITATALVSVVRR